ncbi:MAG: tRNA dihydrouridine synthase DusB [Venatoribacter sp.]
MPSIGPYALPNPVVLAPMAGVTDRPFRQLCRKLGAGLVVGEMVAANPSTRNSRKTLQRINHTGEPEPIAVQIVGGDPEIMAAGARFNVTNGAQIIDINMGCPAKKVCNKAAGSALMKDEALVKDILQAVVEAVEVPVTLKIRTGWDLSNRNGVRIAEMAQAAGIAALAVHGRTRACKFEGQAEYDTIRAIKQSIAIPVFANGDIHSAEKAFQVMQYTGADGVLIGRAAQGQPWIFREVAHYLATGEKLPCPELEEVEHILTTHLEDLYDFYGEFLGPKIARKHVSWYLDNYNDKQFRCEFNRLELGEQQLQAVRRWFSNQAKKEAVA